VEAAAVIAAFVAAAAVWAPPPLVYQQNRSDTFASIYVLTVHGSRRLLHDTSSSYVPAWSPDGRRIAFASERYGGDWIFVVDADGRHLRELTFGGHTPTQDEGDDGEPTWSPDGKHIAFADSQHINVMDADGRHRHVVIDGPGQEQYDPRWSPDGRRIAYAVVDPDTQERGIWVAASDGSARHELTSPYPLYDGSPAWAPDGRRIAFTRSDANGHSQVWVMNADGSGARPFTSGSVNEAPAWSPDGRSLAFSSDRARHNHLDLYVMPSSGGAAVRLTHCPGSCTDPDWRRTPLRSKER
jgi:TolB protein